jgi:hypothetical protein
MKRILLLFSVITCLLFASCDENNPTDAAPYIPVPVQNKFVTASINGEAHMFDQTTVEKEELVSSEGVPYTDLIVTANKKNDTSSQIVQARVHAYGSRNLLLFLVSKRFGRV